MDDALQRQLDELEALAAIYCGEGESCNTTHTASGEMAVSINIALPEGASAALHVVLPQMYPAVPPTNIDVSCAGALNATEIQDIRSALLDIALSAADDDREALAELCLTLQQEVAHRLESRKQSVGSLQHGPIPTSRSAATAFGRRMVWFHHIKSFEKRKEIVEAARGNRLRGLCKPGFPGVIVVEGDEERCEEFVRAIRTLKWQAMDVRWAQRLEDVPERVNHHHQQQQQQQQQQLPDPFIELDEGAMGECAALCEAAGLLSAFRASILKLDHPGPGPGPGSDHRSSDQSGVAEDTRPAWLEHRADDCTASVAAADDDVPAAAATRETAFEELLVRIDHMNNSASYTKLLRRWTEQLGVCGCRLLHAGPDRGVPRRENVLCVLHAEAEALRAFLQRLRTQMVDIDRSGRPCKERQATVQWQQPLRAACEPLQRRGGAWSSVARERRRCATRSEPSASQMRSNSAALSPPHAHGGREVLL